jgi:hypothetical protein
MPEPQAHVAPEPVVGEQLETTASAVAVELRDSMLGIGLMTVPTPDDRDFVERTRKLIELADMDARAVAAELLR